MRDGIAPERCWEWPNLVRTGHSRQPALLRKCAASPRDCLSCPPTLKLTLSSSTRRSSNGGLGLSPTHLRGDQRPWAASNLPSSTAAARYEPVGDRLWSRYAAVRHDGGLDVGLGADCGRRREGGSVVSLLPTVGRIWSYLALYQQVHERIGCAGPWEVSLGITSTADAVLAGFAEGWQEPDSGWKDEISVCSEPNLLFRREVDDMTSDWPERLAYSLGGQLEDAFGSGLRRFRARTGQFIGQFDRARYR